MDTTEPGDTPEPSVPKKTARRRAPRKKASAPAVSAEDRFHMIQEAAYLIAEKDNFRGDPSAYWFAAEQEVASKLGA